MGRDQFLGIQIKNKESFLAGRTTNIDGRDRRGIESKDRGRIVDFVKTEASKDTKGMKRRGGGKH